IVDEYQDINPAQEALIATLARDPVELCVVGDDDQSIYQWRGSDVRNIVEFARRYKGVRRFEVTRNRRSRPEIIKVSNRFAESIAGRLPKRMDTFRPGADHELYRWRAPTEEAEADHIASVIQDLVKKGFRYREVAILVRSSTTYDQLLRALREKDIPVQP